MPGCHKSGQTGRLGRAGWDGPNFCTGFDLSDLEAETDDTLLARFVRVELLLQKVHRAPLMTASLAHGKTLGAGADKFACCSVRWASPGATFAFPGAGFGLVLGSGRLGALVGPVHASAWILSGRQITAQEATLAGLVQRCEEELQTPALRQTLTKSIERLDHATQTRSAQRCTGATALTMPPISAGWLNQRREPA